MGPVRWTAYDAVYPELLRLKPAAHPRCVALAARIEWAVKIVERWVPPAGFCMTNQGERSHSIRMSTSLRSDKDTDSIHQEDDLSRRFAIVCEIAVPAT